MRIPDWTPELKPQATELVNAILTRRGGVLLTLLIMPLYIPVLIFATNAVTAAAAGMPIAGQIYFLASLLVLALTLAPLAIAAALRISVS